MITGYAVSQITTACPALFQLSVGDIDLKTAESSHITFIQLQTLALLLMGIGGDNKNHDT